MTIETTVNKHRGVMLLAIGGFLVFLYVRHKRQQQAAAAADAAAAAAAAVQDPGTMDQNTYSKQFSSPAPAYLGAPFSGYGANVTYPPPTQLQPGAGGSPTPPITFPNPGASSGDSTVGAATGGGAPSSGGTGQGPMMPTDPIPPELASRTAADAAAGMAAFQKNATLQQPKNPAGLPNPYATPQWVLNNADGSPGNIDDVVGYTGPQVGSGLYTGAAGEPGAPGYQGIGWVPPEYRPK